MAERGGFEPPVVLPTHAFQACALNHSATSPAFKLQRFTRSWKPGIDHLILRSDTGCVKTQQRKPTVSAKPAEPDAWQKTPYAKLVRYVPSQEHLARIRIGGKLIRWSLKTTTLTVAKLRLADLEKAERLVEIHSLFGVSLVCNEF